MELLAVLEDENRRAFRRQRVFLDRTNPLEVFDDQGLIMRYRFPKVEILKLIEMCSVQLRRETLRSKALPVYIQVLAGLRFFATGSYQQCTSDILGISQPSLSRAISNVTQIILENAKVFVNFGNSNDGRKFDFYSLAGFPNVIGAIDGTHIKIQSPGGISESLFICRKGGYSVNVQIVCDAKMNILDAVVKWPGSTHDSFIWKNSSLREKFVNNPPNGYLIGDSGYCIEPWLLTPFPSTQALTIPEENYQNSFVKTRRLVENTIGLWKSIFRCLIDNVLLYKPKKVCQLIAATIVLHNIRRKLRLHEDDTYVEPNDFMDDDITCIEMSDTTRLGFTMRKNLVDNFFV